MRRAKQPKITRRFFMFEKTATNEELFKQAKIIACQKTGISNLAMPDVEVIRMALKALAKSQCTH